MVKTRKEAKAHCWEFLFLIQPQQPRKPGAEACQQTCVRCSLLPATTCSSSRQSTVEVKKPGENFCDSTVLSVPKVSPGSREKDRLKEQKGRPEYGGTQILHR